MVICFSSGSSKVSCHNLTAPVRVKTRKTVHNFQIKCDPTFLTTFTHNLYVLSSVLLLFNQVAFTKTLMYGHCNTCSYRNSNSIPKISNFLTNSPMRKQQFIKSKYNI